MSADAAPAWPDDVVEDVLVGALYCACDVPHDHPMRHKARAALAALAPYLAAREAAARIAGREEGKAACTAQLRNTSFLLSNPPQSSAAWDARNAIAALPPPAGSDALAEHTQRAVAAERDAIASEVERAWPEADDLLDFIRVRAAAIRSAAP